MSLGPSEPETPVDAGTAVFVDVHVRQCNHPPGLFLNVVTVGESYGADPIRSPGEVFRTSPQARLACPCCGRRKIFCYSDPDTCDEIRIRADSCYEDSGFKSWLCRQVPRQTGKGTTIGRSEGEAALGNSGIQGDFNFPDACGKLLGQGGAFKKRRSIHVRNKLAPRDF